MGGLCSPDTFFVSGKFCEKLKPRTQKACPGYNSELNTKIVIYGWSIDLMKSLRDRARARARLFLSVNEGVSEKRGKNARGHAIGHGHVEHSHYLLTHSPSISKIAASLKIGRWGVAKR